MRPQRSSGVSGPLLNFITETPVDALLATLWLLLGFIAGTFFGYCRGHFRSSSCYIEPLISSPLLLSSR